jgi:probable phosphoglycerate mutase
MILKKIFYFVRHGQTDWNTKGVEQSDIPLNEVGFKQAQIVAKNIAHLSILLQAPKFISDFISRRRI